MTLFYWIGAAVCLVYLVLTMIAVGGLPDFWIFWPAAACLLAAMALVTRHVQASGGSVWSIVRMACPLLLVIIFAFFAGMTCFIFAYDKPQGEEDLDVLVVLGAHVNGTDPSPSLERRLEAACAYAREHPKTLLILSGGKGEDEEISEAECMQQYLLARGIPARSLFLEDKSTSTRENLLFSDQLTGCGKKKTGIVSNSFHVHRATLLAKKLGYRNVVALPAKTSRLMLPHWLVRESLAMVKEKLKGNI